MSRTTVCCRRAAAIVTALSVVVCCYHASPSLALSAEVGSGRLADQLLERAGARNGVCSLLGPNGDLPLELARASELLVHVRQPDEAAVAALRELAEAAGYGIDRVVVEQGSLGKLPFVDNMVDIVIMTQATRETLDKLSLAEVLRVLRPEGIAIVGQIRPTPSGDSDLDAVTLRQWANATPAQQPQTYSDAHGVWVQLQKPAQSGTDDWSHWEKGPDNNPVSLDQVIRAPYLTQFLSGPLYIGMPSITTVAGGRTFLAIGHIAHHRREWESLNKLVAHNGYNGTFLWERPLPEGYLVHRSAFIATKDTFYMIDGEGSLMLDAATGKEKGRISMPGVQGDWKWMAMDQGTLYVLAGKPERGEETTKGDRTLGGWSWDDLSKGYYARRFPFGFGDTLAAYDLARNRLVWKHKEESLIDSRGMAVIAEKVFLYCPDRHLRSLDSKSGQIQWTNDDSSTLELIEEPGRKLTSTPGFRTACIAVATPYALIIQGQTRMNVIAVSTDDGRLLWTKKKITNNPNAIYVDDKLVLGVGPGGSHLVIDPVTGQELDDLEFYKTACTRLTASGDSLFCRGEGTLRFDRQSKRVLVDGAARPGCNDGAIPANGLLYIGPWQCDCNLSLIGALAKCSAGDFSFDYVGTESDRLQRGHGEADPVQSLSITHEDWPTYRGNNHRTGGTPAKVQLALARRWQSSAARPYTPTEPTAAGGLVYVAGSDGKVRAIDGGTGDAKWEFETPAPIKYPPTIWDGRAYVGSGDGYAYCLEAATGRLLWRFRAAPVDRYIMAYGAVSSTWPVHSGVLVHDGAAYFGAGIIDQDGTYVYALDAKTGQIKWQNNASGHLSPQLRKGVSVQGNLTLLEDRLLMAAGNQVSPAPFDLASGQCLAEPFDQGRPKANSGKFVGVLGDETVIAGGRILHAAPENVPTKGSFVAFAKGRPYQLNNGGVPPAWDDRSFVMVNFKHGKVTCCDADKVAERIGQGYDDTRSDRRPPFASLAAALVSEGAVRWQTDLDQSMFEAISLAVCPNAIVGVVRYQQQARAQPQWFLVALDTKDGRTLAQRELQGDPLPGGLLVDRDGQVIVTMLDGDVVCFGAELSG